MNLRGHNENAVRLSMLADDAQRGLQRVAAGEADAIEGWLAYGAALNEGRALFPSDEKFGQWVKEIVSSNLEDTMHPAEQSAAMWAAAHRDQFEEARAAGKARTVRGIHDKWKQIEAEREKAHLAEERKAEDARKRAEAEAARQEAEDKAKAEAEARAAAAAAETDDERQEAEAKIAEAAEATAVAEKVAAEAEAEIEPEPTPEDEPEFAKLRKEYRKLTPEAQEDDWIGLHLSLAEARKTIADQKTELAELKAWWAATSEGTDHKRGLAIADRQIRTTEGRMKEYQMIAKRATRRAEILEAENKRLRAEIENQVIPL